MKLYKERCYDRVPTLVATSHKSEVPVLRNQQVKIDRTLRNNTPDIIIRDN